MIKLLCALLPYLKIKPDIHQGERLCARLLPTVPQVSEKNSSRHLGEQVPSPPMHVSSLGRYFYHYFSEVLFPSSEIPDMVVRYAN